MEQQIPPHVKDKICSEINIASEDASKSNYGDYVPFSNGAEWMLKQFEDKWLKEIALQQPTEPLWLNLADHPYSGSFENLIIRRVDNKEPINDLMRRAFINGHVIDLFHYEYLNPSLTAAPQQKYEWVNMGTKEWTSDEITSALPIRWADGIKNLIPDKLKCEMKSEIYIMSKLYLSQYEYLRKNY